MKSSFSTKHIAFLGNHLPRHCGIATFTSSLCEAIATEFSQTKCQVVSVNDIPEGYHYPSRVTFEIEEENFPSYQRAAEFLNFNNIQLVSIQHEFGIYGGEQGSYLLEFLKTIRMPAVMTLHTVLERPNKEQFFLMKEFDRLCKRFVVMAEKGKMFLETIYGISPEKIDLIPHGVIDVPFIDPNFYKDFFCLENKTVLLTFGLLSPNKGIEYVIKALPAILKKHPQVVYVVLGETHPHQLAENGEAYREKLVQLAHDYGVGKQVVFFNQFVSTDQLKEFIGATDIYVTPYCNEAQITSGTLAYAFGAGKAILSTPYWHAQELLTQKRGILVPFEDTEAIANGVIDLLSNPALMLAMRKQAWKAGREMIWSAVGRRYMESFEKARETPRASFAGTKNKIFPVPTLKLDHLITMSDQTGILQHATYNVPNLQEGYCVDDNARAFILTLLLQETDAVTVQLSSLASCYLAFLCHALHPETCHFRNFMNYERRWTEHQGSEDSHARALWAIGTGVRRSKNEDHRRLCNLLFQRALPVVSHFISPRGWAFTLLGIDEYLHVFQGDCRVKRVRDSLTEQLAALYNKNHSAQWCWFEQHATYDNAKLSHAMILSGAATKNKEVLEVGLTSLLWLLEAQTTENNFFSPIGCHGFWKRGEEKARFDQQPLEAYAMVSACLAAYGITKNPFWKKSALSCFEWFLGRNELGLSLYDPTTGGCRDGLTQDYCNENQGAESTLSFYLALAEIIKCVKR